MTSRPDQADPFRRFAERAHGGGNEAVVAAAAIAFLPNSSERDWLALFHMVTSQGRLSDALEVSLAAGRRFPVSEEIALLKPAALGRLRRSGAERAGYEAVAATFPHCAEVRARLAGIAWRDGGFDEALELVEQAFALGLRGQDHIAELGVTAAIRLGWPDRAVAISHSFGDQAWRSRTTDRIQAAEAERAACEAELEPGPITIDQLEAMLAAGRHDLTRHAAVRLLHQHNSPRELKFVIHRTYPLGPSGWYLPQWAGHKGRRDYPDHPDFLWSASVLAFDHGDFEVAAEKLRLIVDSNIDPDLLLRWLTFAAAGGGLSNEQLGLEAERLAQRAGRAGAYRLTSSYLRNSDPARARFWGEGVEDGDLSAPKPPGRLLRRFYRSPRDRPPRIAVCVAGQLRGFREAWAFTKAALAPWDATVFVSTWPGVGAGVGFNDILVRLLPSAITQRLPENLLRKTTVEARLPHLFSAMTEAANVSQEDLCDLYGAATVRLHDEHAFEARCSGRPGLQHNPDHNQAKMFFTMADANDAKAGYELEHGFIFDAVLRIRPDRPMIRLSHADVERVLTSRIVLTDYLHPGGLGDQVLLSSSELADVYSTIWPELDASGSPAYLPGASGQLAEHLLAEHLLHHGARIGLFDASEAGHARSAQASLPKLWRALLADLESSPPHPEAGLIAGAFFEAAAEEVWAGQGEAYVRLSPSALRPWGIQERLSDRARASLIAD